MLTFTDFIALLGWEWILSGLEGASADIVKINPGHLDTKNNNNNNYNNIIILFGKRRNNIIKFYYYYYYCYHYYYYLW